MNTYERLILRLLISILEHSLWQHGWYGKGSKSGGAFSNCGYRAMQTVYDAKKFDKDTPSM